MNWRWLEGRLCGSSTGRGEAIAERGELEGGRVVVGSGTQDRLELRERLEVVEETGWFF